jgi:hypothetical protein
MAIENGVGNTNSDNPASGTIACQSPSTANAKPAAAYRSTQPPVRNPCFPPPIFLLCCLLRKEHSPAASLISSCDHIWGLSSTSPLAWLFSHEFDLPPSRLVQGPRGCREAASDVRQHGPPVVRYLTSTIASISTGTFRGREYTPTAARA